MTRALTILLTLSFGFDCTATTRRAFLQGMAALLGSGGMPSAPSEMLGPISEPSALPDLMGLNLWDLHLLAMKAIMRAEGLREELSREEYARRFRRMREFFDQATDLDLYERAFPDLTPSEVDRLLEHCYARLAAANREAFSQFQRTFTRPKVRTREPEPCEPRLQLPDVLRVWTFGPDLGRPLSEVTRAGAGN